MRKRISDAQIRKRIKIAADAPLAFTADEPDFSDPYWLFESSGTSHGTPYNYDSHVPVLFFGMNVKPGRYDGRIAVNDIAPTLATMLDVEIPSGAAGRVLTEMLIEQ